MLSEDYLSHALAQVEATRKQGEEYQKSEGEILKNYIVLANENRRLKKDYEDLRQGHTEPRHQNKDGETSSQPYVLILIDGNQHIFKDEDLRDGSEGGQRAADRLTNRAEAVLEEMGLQHCMITVRIYADVAKLTTAAMKAKLCEDNVRTLVTVASFVRGFNQARVFFDYIDAGKMMAFKIVKMLIEAVQDPRCSHVFVGSRTCAEYADNLYADSVQSKRITIISGLPSENDQIITKLRTGDFPGVFRSEASGTQDATPPKRTYTSAELRSYAGVTPRSSQTKAQCPFSALRICKFDDGDDCNYDHQCARKNTKQQNPRVRHEDDAESITITTQSSRAQSVQGSEIQEGREECDDARYGCGIPMEDGFPVRRIPLNKDGHRLDCTIESPLNSSWEIYKARSRKRRLCPEHHLEGGCRQGSFCRYDHAPASPDELTCLRLITRLWPCRAGGKCRQSTCTKSHICTRHCEHRGGWTTCKLPRVLHLDPDAQVVYSWVPAQNIPRSAPVIQEYADTTISGPCEHDANERLIDDQESAGESDADIDETCKHNVYQYTSGDVRPFSSSQSCPGGWPSLI